MVTSSPAMTWVLKVCSCAGLNAISKASRPNSWIFVNFCLSVSSRSNCFTIPYWSIGVEIILKVPTLGNVTSIWSPGVAPDGDVELISSAVTLRILCDLLVGDVSDRLSQDWVIEILTSVEKLELASSVLNITSSIALISDSWASPNERYL